MPTALIAPWEPSSFSDATVHPFRSFRNTMLSTVASNLDMAVHLPFFRE